MLSAKDSARHTLCSSSPSRQGLGVPPPPVCLHGVLSCQGGYAVSSSHCGLILPPPILSSASSVVNTHPGNFLCWLSPPNRKARVALAIFIEWRVRLLPSGRNWVFSHPACVNLCAKGGLAVVLTGDGAGCSGAHSRGFPWVPGCCEELRDEPPLCRDEAALTKGEKMWKWCEGSSQPPCLAVSLCLAWCCVLPFQKLPAEPSYDIFIGFVAD